MKTKYMCLMLLFLSFTSCRQMLDSPPVLVSHPVSLLSSEHGTFQHAGISFECCNTGDRQISSINVSFVVFTSAEGGNPFYGSNVITADVTTDLAPGMSGLFEISLDARLAFLPVSPFFIDYFYVRKVVFSDGTEWSDPLGVYYAGSQP